MSPHPPTSDLTAIHCGASQCGAFLGWVGPSVRSGNPRPVWHIQAGWAWEITGSQRGVPAGILARVDQSGRLNRQLYHEVFKTRPDPTGAVGARREADLPIFVRCPSCRSIRYVPPEPVRLRLLTGTQ